MLHSKKSLSILQWYNSLTAKGDVNSLDNFTDGCLFYEIVASLQPFLTQGNKEGNLTAESVIFSETSIACNEEVITSVEEEAAEGKMETCVSESENVDPFVIKESDHTDTQKKYDVIRKFIDDLYHVESSSLIDYGECQKGKELELAKVAVFLLTAIVQNLLSSKDEVLFNTTLLDLEVQENIYECLALIFELKDEGENQIKKSDFHKVLSRPASYKAGTPVRKSARSNSDTNDVSESAKNVLKKRKERSSVVYEDQPSPLKNYLDSPKIRQKAEMLRKESELRKLRSALLSEENKVMDFTLEIQNLNKQLGKKKKELEFYKKELESHREALNEKEEQEKLRAEELKDKKIEAEKVQKLIESQEEEIKQLKENNEALQEKVAGLEKKLEQNATTSLIEENNNLKDRIQKLEVDNAEKADRITTLEEKITDAEKDLQKYKEFSASNSRREFTGSSNVPETLSKIIYADKQPHETSERKEREPKQDLETKDERVKPLAPPQSKGERSKNKSFIVESLKIKDNLHERVPSLEKVKNEPQIKLEIDGSKYGSTSDDIPVVSSLFVPKDLNSIKKEIEIGSATDNDNKMDAQLWTGVSDDAQHSRTDSNIVDDQDKMIGGKNEFLRSTLKSIVKQLGQKNCIPPENVQILKDDFSKVDWEDPDQFSATFRNLLQALQKVEHRHVEPSVTTRSRSLAAEKAGKNLEQNIKASQKKSDAKEDLKSEIKGESKNDIKNEIEQGMNEKLGGLEKEPQEDIETLRNNLANVQEKYLNMVKLAKKKDDDVKKALIMYQRIVQLNKKDNNSKKECGEGCEKLRRRCKQLNECCCNFEKETEELKRVIKHLQWMMDNLKFDITELKKEKKELQQKLWEETSAFSKNTTDRDALVLHYLKKSKHEPKRNKDIELEKEEKRYSRPIVKVDAYILNSESEPSMSNSVLASRSIRSSYFQVADEDDFLNESSLAEIHHGGIPEGESGENRLLELQRRNTLCPPHLQSSYPLEIQNMTPSERKYYNPEEVSYDLSRKSSLYNVKRDSHKKPRSEYMESDSDDSDGSHSFPVKKRKISEADCISVPVSKKTFRPSSSVSKVPAKDQGNLRKPSTPLKRVAAFVKKQSSTFKTPQSVTRLIRMQRKSKIH